ncbi:MAG TPA: hypothetical protein VJB37_00500 [Patescibacteria group bacterium]|nr:hypothetical protein [Patescibacteria group bacterium]
MTSFSERIPGTEAYKMRKAIEAEEQKDGWEETGGPDLNNPDSESQPEDQEAAEEKKGRSCLDYLTRGNYSVSDPETGEDRDISRDEFHQLLQEKPALADELNKLTNDQLTAGTCETAVSQLNDVWGSRREMTGIYKEVQFEFPNGLKMKIKIFPEMDNAMSFSGDWTNLKEQ